VANNILLQTYVSNCFLIFTYINVSIRKEAIVLYTVLNRNAGGRYLPIFVSLCYLTVILKVSIEICTVTWLPVASEKFWLVLYSVIVLKLILLFQ